MYTGRVGMSHSRRPLFEVIMATADRLIDRYCRDKTAKMMGLDYFLEMVDHKHRYGSNLRRYHAEWKKADSAYPSG